MILGSKADSNVAMRVDLVFAKLSNIHREK